MIVSSLQSSVVKRITRMIAGKGAMSDLVLVLRTCRLPRNAWRCAHREEYTGF